MHMKERKEKQQQDEFAGLPLGPRGGGGVSEQVTGSVAPAPGSGMHQELVLPGVARL